ncbi:hypothetical protein [Nonomuraea sp. NPDC049625]|uniref:hypothetical protein n=1 Tax=Nonomuraea sp. NPDC049625 TaxID=3155775 RepID=UPI003433D48D
MATSPVQLTAAEQAKALLADAANKDRFYENSSICDDQLRYALRKGDDAATAMYAAQAATAHAVLGVVDQLGELRAEVRQAVGAPREDLFQLASALRGLAAALTASAERDADVAGAIRALTGTLAERMDTQADQVQAVRAEVEDGLAAMADTMTLLFDRRRGHWWSRLWPSRRRHVAMAASETAAEPERVAEATQSFPPLDTAPLVPAIPAGQRALEQLAHLREVLADWAVTLPNNPNRSGLRQGLAATLYETWEATHAVIPKVVDSSVSGPVQDAVLRLGSALEEMGPAGVPSMESVRAVSDRLTELLKVVAAQAVAARAEVDAR